MEEITWLEVSLTVDGELAEPVAEVLARFIPNGVVIESTAVTAEMDDSAGRAVGPLRVYGYLSVDDQLETKRQKLEESLWYLGRIRPLPQAEYRQVQLSDWSETWKKHFQPIAIGKRLEIVPAWLENPNPERLPIRIEPGMAFGTGTHPTTQLCLEIIETIFSSTSPHQVIDIGCGSGILSIAALKLGAQYALGVDVDSDAITASRENASLNQVLERMELGLGSLEEILAGAFGQRQAEVVLANILAPVLVQLLEQGLADVLKPGGNLVLSGILEEQSADVEAALRKHGLRLVERRQQGDWVALWAQK